VRAQTAAPSTRMFALTTGTLGLLAVGVLILTVSPRRQDSPIAISATTTPAVSASAVPEADDPGATPTAIRTPTPGSVNTEMVTLQHALATPIGDGRLAVITDDALGDRDGGHIEVRLRSGRVGSGDLVEKLGDTWLIELHQSEAGHDIASKRPNGSEIVTVMQSPPVTIVLAEIANFDIAEGTAVLDGDGDLVGICTRRRSDGKVRLMEIKAELADAANAGR